PDRELHRRRRARGNAEHGAAPDAERIEQRRVRVRLCRGRRVWWHRRAQISKSGCRDDVESTVRQRRAAELHALIEAPPGPPHRAVTRTTMTLRAHTRLIRLAHTAAGQES